MVVIVMGPSGAGKSTVGGALAEALGWPFHDGDDLHPPENRARMRSGVPLTDLDRAPWLAALREAVHRTLAEGKSAVVAASALRRIHREALVPQDAPSGAVRFVHLDASPELLAERLARRTGHFFPPALLASQLATLEPPAHDEGAAILTVDASEPVARLVARIRTALGR